MFGKQRKLSIRPKSHRQADDRFPLLFGERLELRCAGSDMICDVGHNEIGLCDHPSISEGDRKATQHGLYSVWKDRREKLLAYTVSSCWKISQDRISTDRITVGQLT